MWHAGVKGTCKHNKIIKSKSKLARKKPVLLLFTYFTLSQTRWVQSYHLLNTTLFHPLVSPCTQGRLCLEVRLPLTVSLIPRLSPEKSKLQVTKSWAGPENKVNKVKQ